MKLGQIKKLYIDGKLPKPEYIEKMFKIHQHLFEYCELIKNTDLEKIEITNSSVIATTNAGIKILCNSLDRRLAPIEILNFGSYEKAESKIALTLIEDGYCIFDVGANFGWYSLLFAKYFKKSRIFAFEPVGETFKYLKINIRLNDASNLQAYNLGLSDQTGEQVFYFRPEESVSASIADLNEDKKARKVVCKIVRLDDFVSKKKLKVDFIKCDVEGAEILVFKGAIETISKNKPIIFAEMLRKWSAKFTYHPNEIIKLLKNIDYDCFTIKDGSLKKLLKITASTVETNFFFLHTKKHESKIRKLAA